MSKLNKDLKFTLLSDKGLEELEPLDPTKNFKIIMPELYKSYVEECLHKYKLNRQLYESLYFVEVEDLPMEILECPICKKKPKVKRDFNYEASGFGAWCKIFCKCHITECGRASWEDAFKTAVQCWNEDCTNLDNGIVKLL